VIVCSCNVLSEAAILDALKSGEGLRPRTAGEAYRCLGCAPRCGRCLSTVRELAAQAHLANCEVGCSACPAAAEHPHKHEREETPRPYLIAAE
jgi:bacterioferritin-associated ferredoxin